MSPKRTLLIGLLAACTLAFSVPAMATTTLKLLTDKTGVNVLTYPNEGFKQTTSNPFIINSKIAAGLTYALPAAGNHPIAYTPDTNTTGDVVFTLTNGIWASPNSGETYILYDSSANGRVSGTTAAAPTINVNTLTIKGAVLKSGKTYFLMSSGTTTAANHTLNLSTTSVSGTPSPIALAVAQGTVNQASTTLVQYNNFWVASITPASGVIDVAQNIGRKLFFNASGDVATDTISVKFAQASTTQFVFVDGLGAGSSATGLSSTLKLGTSMSSVSYSATTTDATGISSVTFAWNNETPTTLTPDSTGKTYTKNLTTTATAIPGDGNSGVFKLTVDGQTVLNVRNFTVSVTATGTNGYPSTNYLTSAAAGSWTINGYQALCPYVNTNPSFGTQFVLNNTTGASVDVYWDVVSSSNSAVSGNLSNYAAKQVTGKTSIPAKTTMFFDAPEVLTGLGLPSTDASGAFYRNQLQVTVTGSPSSVTGMAIQADGTAGKRSEPLFPTAPATMTGTIVAGSLTGTVTAGSPSM